MDRIAWIHSGPASDAYPGRVLFTVLISAIVLVSFSPARAARRERLIDSWKPINYNITLAFNDALSEIASARVAVTVQAVKDVSVIDLDFGDLPIDSVMIDAIATPFSRASGLLNIRLAKPLPRDARAVIVVEYHGSPRDGLVLSNDKAGKPSAIGDNWPDRVHKWIPCLDHPSAKATVTFTVTAPARDLVVANGRLDQVKDDSPGTRTWTYTEGVPIPAYCMVIAAGEYAKSEPASSAVAPLAYYVPQSDAKFAT